MKTISHLSVLLVMCWHFYSCSNAPKTATALSDSTKIKDTIALIKTDTLTKASIAKSENPPPPTFLEMRAVKKEEFPDEVPSPYYDEDLSSELKIPTASDPDPIVSDSESKIHTVVEQMPVFKGFSEFFDENFSPMNGVDFNSYNGAIKIRFIVDKYGYVKDTKIIQSSGSVEIDKEVINTISQSSGKWTPGKIKGMPVNTQMTLPIFIDLDE
ncbi:MAG: energy transducer TonB [Chitinophagaceae bacterium]